MRELAKQLSKYYTSQKVQEIPPTFTEYVKMSPQQKKIPRIYIFFKRAYHWPKILPEQQNFYTTIGWRVIPFSMSLLPCQIGTIP